MAVLAFALFWVFVALTLFFIAISGGPRAAREQLHSQSQRGRKFAFGGFAVVFAGLGIGIPTLVIASSKQKRSDSQQTYFASTCGVCHTLAAAGSTGVVGPNLDQLKPTALRVENSIRIGGIGDGQMPAGLLQGQQAHQLAVYVAAVAGAR